jgi:N-acetylmuramoyl-L-alanine amidase
VVRFRIWLATALASGAIIGSLLRAQVEEQSRREEAEQIEAHASASPNPKKSPSPAAKASRDKSGKKHRAPARNASHSDAGGGSATSEKAPTAIPHAKLANEESEKKTDRSPKEKKSPTPIPKAKAAIEESTADDNESQDAQESPRPRKAKLAKKSDGGDEATPAATPRETPEPSALPKSKRHQTPTPKPKSKKSEKEVSRKTKKAGKSKSTRKEEETPKPEKTPEPRAEERAAVSESPTPVPKARGVSAPTPAASAQPKALRSPSSGERAQVVIEKSGLEEDQGLEPPPSPPPRRFGFWPWSRSSSNYRYLTRSVIEAIRRAPVKRRRWQFIVVHNSGTRQGNARVFDYYHRHVRRMQNGLAYHFVIGNGTSTGNGQIEVGDRWRRQINGGHVHSDYLNNISLGICLVGDFNRDQPTRAQLDACEELIRYLRERCGKTDRGTIPVRPHREMNPPRWPTDCPGDDFPYSWFRRF